MEQLLSTIRFQTIIAWFRRHATAIVFTCVLLISGLSHGYNMLNYPYYESDEGTYTSQAWSLLNGGTLAPYTYWYDHPPFGWIVISLWAKILPDGIFTFGTSIDTGRVLMLVIHLISTGLIFFITKRLTKSTAIAALACLVYGLSPIGIYFRRRVLLDNIMNMWLLLSIAILFFRRLSLRHFALSGLLFAFAFLTKISAFFFLPTIISLILTGAYQTHKVFRTVIWLGVAGLSILIYPFYSMLKGEFLPVSVTGGRHVSLLETLFFQMSRGNAVPFFKSGSDFLAVFHDWILRDLPYIVLLGAILVASIFIAFRNMMVRTFLFGALFYILFLIRGKVVINFYIIPLLSFFAILLALIVQDAMQRITTSHFALRSTWSRQWLTVIPSVLIVFTLGYYVAVATTKHLTADEVTNQRKAIDWIKDNLPEDADIIIDDIMLVELRDPNYRNEKIFNNAEWFYKVSRDPAIRDEKYNGNWRTFDYIGLTHEMLKQIDLFEESDISLLAFKNSLPMAKWTDNTTSYIDEQKFITTNGDWAMVYKINGNTKAQLVDTWQYYKNSYIHSYGQVIDPSTDATTSEGQSYALLRAVWLNDKATFDGVWAWTEHHLQHRLDDKLLSWKWKDDKVADAANATDADQDIALALLFASKVWSDPIYEQRAKEIINDLWEVSVVEINGTLFLLPMNESHAQINEGYLFNPSYLSPAHYRIFADVDHEHDWLKLTDDTYRTLQNTARLTPTGLPANWYTLNRKTGALSAAPANFGSGSQDLFSYDAFRVFWRVGLDAKWFNAPEAKNYLNTQGSFLLKESQKYARLPNVYNPYTGEASFSDDSLAIQTGYFIALNYADKNKANNYYDSTLSAAYAAEGYWGEKDNYYDQNWAWLAAGLFNDDLSNLWKYN